MEVESKSNNKVIIIDKIPIDAPRVDIEFLCPGFIVILLTRLLFFILIQLGFEKVVKMKTSGNFLQAHVKFLTHHEASLVIQKINGLLHSMSSIFDLTQLTS